DGIRVFHVTGVQTCALPILKTFFVKPVLLFLFSVLIIACGKDNYEAPSSMLTGVVTYNGKPVGVRGSNASVRLQLWQDGFPVKTDRKSTRLNSSHVKISYAV